MLNTEFDWEAKRALKKVSVSRPERLYYESVQWRMINCAHLVSLSRSAKGHLMLVKLH